MLVPPRRQVAPSTCSRPHYLIATSTPPQSIITSTTSTTTTKNGKDTQQQQQQQQLQQPRRPIPFLKHLGSLPLIQATCRTVSVLRLSPLFTPRATFARWRTHRAMRAAARAARQKEIKRDWQKHFRMNGLTWHHLYISQDLHRVASMLRDLDRSMSATIDNANRNNEKNRNKKKRSSTTSFTPAMSGATLVHLERSFAFLLDNVYDVYNSLEKHVLFPWIINGVKMTTLGTNQTSNSSTVSQKNDNFEALDRAMTLFSKERDRIEDRADVIRSRFSRVVCSTGFPYASLGPCTSSRTFSATRLRREKRRGEDMDARARAAALRDGGEEGADKEIVRRRRSSLYVRLGFIPGEDDEASSSMKGLGKKKIEDTNQVNMTVVKKWRAVPVDDVRSLHTELNQLIEDTERLHRTERNLLYPIIANKFSEQEQNRITNVIVYSMRSALAKLLITVFHQSVEKHASRSQWKFYKREVPLPIRVYTPVWRARLYDGSPLGWLKNTSIKDMSESPLVEP